MIATLILGLVLANIGLIGTMHIGVNEGTKLHFIWLIPLLIIGIVILGSSLRETIM